MNLTNTFIEGIIEFSDSVISDESLHQIKRCLLDYVGVTNAGAKDIRDRISPFLEIGTEGVCTVIGFARKTDIHTAAIVNGFSSHMIELDDGHRFGMLHLEATIITALLAVAQQERVPFDRFIKGVLVGYEATVRLAIGIQPNHKQKGFHATGTCGAIGVACGVGYALGLNSTQINGAISAAATSAAGLLEVIDDGSQLKPYNVANAVDSGINAAYIGKCGFQGPNDVLGGKRGFINAFSSRTEGVDVEKIIRGTGEISINQIYVKPYAACRHCHAPVECALKIRKSKNFDISEIDRIEVQTYKLAIFGHDQTEVSNASAAKMSTPYSVAVALTIGSCGMEAFSPELISRKDIKSLSAKVRVIENERLTAVSPAKRGAIVKAYLRNGQCISAEVEYPLGEPENNMSDEALKNKYDSLMQYAGVSEERRHIIKSMIWTLEDSYNTLITNL